MNEEHVRQVIELERQAQDICEAAGREAEQLPSLAERESRALIEQARAEAQAKAGRLVSDARARAEEERARIIRQAEQEAQRMKALAMGRFDRAVGFVLNRVTGKE